MSALTPIDDSIMKARSEVLVIAIVGKALAERWWASPNLAFDGQTPTEAWATTPDRVYQYLMSHAAGDY